MILREAAIPSVGGVLTGGFAIAAAQGARAAILARFSGVILFGFVVVGDIHAEIPRES